MEIICLFCDIIVDCLKNNCFMILETDNKLFYYKLFIDWFAYTVNLTTYFNFRTYEFILYDDILTY